MTWVNTTVADMNVNRNAISINQTTTWNFKFGRVCSANYLALVRVHFVAKLFRFMDSSGYENTANGATTFQLLTCMP